MTFLKSAFSILALLKLISRLKSEPLKLTLLKSALLKSTLPNDELLRSEFLRLVFAKETMYKLALLVTTRNVRFVTITDIGIY